MSKIDSNFWPWRCVFGTFFRDIAKLPADWDKFTPWEEAARYGSIRYMHPKFTIVSDCPEILRLDEQGRPHCVDGPSHRWRDGFEFYHLWGVRVPAKYALTPAIEINPKEVLLEKNVEVRTAVIKKCGFQHFLNHLNAKQISKNDNAELIEFDFGNNITVRGLRVCWNDRSGKNETVIPVPRTREQFEKSGDVPENIDCAESVRRWTLYAGKNTEFVNET